MVVTRSQSSENIQIEPDTMDYYSDTGSDVCIPECKSCGATNDIERPILLDLERDHERIRNNRKFFNMNIQISELTSIVEALADQITSTKTNSE